MKQVLLAIMLWASMGVFAQEEEVERELLPKLEDLYLDANYDKLEFKAYDMQYNEKYNKEPMVYMYLFVVNFQFHKNEEYHEDFPKGLRDAIKYLVKFYAKDRDSLYRDQYVDDIAELQAIMLDEAENYMAEEDWRKALSMYKNIIKMHPESQVAWMMRAALEVKQDMNYEAQESVEEAMLLENSISTFEDLPVVHQTVLRDFLVDYCAYWVGKHKEEIAETAVALAAPYFEGDEDIQAQLDEMLAPEVEEEPILEEEPTDK